MKPLPRYDIAQSYDWNYAHAPDPVAMDVPAIPGAWDFCGLPVASPLGMPAGPLLNGRWILYYASLGFDVLTYKTVRSSHRDCYPVPNLLPVRGGTRVTAAGDPTDSWAISFGMPSKDPAIWRADIEQTCRALGPRQVLCVSVVASPEDGWGLDEIAADFARCARWAADAGAQVVEANLSCPNVCTGEADLYLSARAARAVAQACRAAVPALPLALKIGAFDNLDQMRETARAVAEYTTALSTMNSVTAPVFDAGGEPLFGGLRRGIGGAWTTSRCLDELRLLAEVIREERLPLRLIGVGGVATADHVRARLAAGAHQVQIATAAMLDPECALRIRRNW